MVARATGENGRIEIARSWDGKRRNCRAATARAYIAPSSTFSRGGGIYKGGRGLPFHDVVQLIGVQRLPLEQRLGHDLHLVPVFLDQTPRQRILLVDDAAYLLVDLLQRHLGNVLVRGNRTAEEH